jgi:hypothetical protein
VKVPASSLETVLLLALFLLHCSSSTFGKKAVLHPLGWSGVSAVRAGLCSTEGRTRSVLGTYTTRLGTVLRYVPSAKIELGTCRIPRSEPRTDPSVHTPRPQSAISSSTNKLNEKDQGSAVIK